MYCVKSYPTSLPKILENLQYGFFPANKVAPERASLPALQFSPVSVIPSMPRTSLHVYVELTRTNSEA